MNVSLLVQDKQTSRHLSICMYTKQHNTTLRNTFSEKNQLPHVGLEPTTFCSLDRVLYQLSYSGSTAGWGESRQGKAKHLNLVNSLIVHIANNHMHNTACELPLALILLCMAVHVL